MPAVLPPLGGWCPATPPLTRLSLDLSPNLLAQLALRTSATSCRVRIVGQELGFLLLFAWDGFPAAEDDKPAERSKGADKLTEATRVDMAWLLCCQRWWSDAAPLFSLSCCSGHGT